MPAFSSRTARYFLSAPVSFRLTFLVSPCLDGNLHLVQLQNAYSPGQSLYDQPPFDEILQSGQAPGLVSQAGQHEEILHMDQVLPKQELSPPASRGYHSHNLMMS